MKNLLAVAVLISALSASAEIVPLTVTLTATKSVQSDTVTTTTFTNTPAPTVYSFTAQNLLATLATDEFFNGRYANGSFPSGAELVFMLDADDFSQSYFEVVDKTGVPLLNVSDLIKLQIADANFVTSGSVGVIKKLPNLSEAVIVKFTFDDTGAVSPGDHNKLFFQGLLDLAATDSAVKNGAYIEKWAGKFANASGAGIDIGTIETQPVIVTASMTFAGSKTLSVQ
jgi:hypothetical protein